MSPRQLAGSLTRFIPAFRPPERVVAWRPRLCSLLPALARRRTARGPDNIADVAENVIEAVVNISTSQTLDASSSRGGGSGRNERGRRSNAVAAADATPQVPPGSPFEDFFEEFFKNRRGPGGPAAQGENNQRAEHAAPRQFARLRLRHRSVGHRGHQQPRHRRSRRSHRRVHRRLAPESRSGRPRPEDRSCPAAREARPSRSRR